MEYHVLCVPDWLNLIVETILILISSKIVVDLGWKDGCALHIDDQAVADNEDFPVFFQLATNWLPNIAAMLL